MISAMPEEKLNCDARWIIPHVTMYELLSDARRLIPGVTIVLKWNGTTYTHLVQTDALTR